MRRRLCPLLLGALILAVAACPGAARGEPPSSAGSVDLNGVAQKARPAVMVLIGGDANGLETARGTAFLVSHDGKLITNRHVARSGPIAFAKARTNRRYRVLGVLAEDHEHDLVLLKIEGADFPSLPLGSSEKLEDGQPLAIVGTRRVSENTIARGYVIEEREFLGERGWIEIRAALEPGSSGSPVLNARGEVVGIITAIFRNDPTRALAIPSEIARQLLAHAGEPRPLADLAGHNSDDVFMDENFMGASMACLAGKFEEAQTRAGILLQRFPDSAAAHLLLAHIDAENGTNDAAIAACQQAIKLNPQYAMAWCELGQIQTRQKKYREAIDALVKATELKPDSLAAWDNLGWAAMQQGDYGRAAGAYREATKLQEDDEKLWYNLGLSYAKQDKQSDAAWAFKVAARLKPNNAEMWRELGTACAKQGQYAPAAEAFERAVKLKPIDAVAIFNLGLAYLQLDEPDKAKTMLDLLRHLDPKKAKVLEKMLEE